MTTARDRQYCEVLVIGSGPGGAITACLLAEAGKRIVLLEEGPHLDIHSIKQFSPQEMDRKYRDGGITATLGKTKVAYVEGRCVGGGSEINSGLYHRLPNDIGEQWRSAYRIADFESSHLQPHFEACEKDLSISDLPTEGSPASLKLKAGADNIKWKVIKTPRWFTSSKEGNGCWRYTRQSMTQTYIPRALKAGCHLLSQTKARRIQVRGNKAYSVLARSTDNKGHAIDLEINFESLFVCGGAIQSPGLLRRSGVKKNIGNSLRVHPTVKFVTRFDDNIYDETLEIPVHQVKEFSPQITFGGSISTPPYLAIGLIDHKKEGLPHLKSWKKMASYYAMIQGCGHGVIRHLPFSDSLIVKYKIDDRDLLMMADGLKKLGRLLFSAGAIELYPSVQGYPVIRTEKELDIFSTSLPRGRTNVMTIHLMASCPMGEDETKCAVDSFGKLHGYDNIYINDASILPGPPGLNPQGIIMALARRNSLHFLQEG